MPRALPLISANAWAELCLCAHILAWHNLIGNAGQRACGQDRSRTVQLHCLQFVAATAAALPA